MPGASHHAWTHPVRPTDQATVVAARRAIVEQVDAWLAQGPMGEEAGFTSGQTEDKTQMMGEEEMINSRGDGAPRLRLSRSGKLPRRR